MLPFLLDLACSGRRLGLASAQLRYRLVGYNEGDPVADVEWALDRVAERYGVPVCLLGHSMGARAAFARRATRRSSRSSRWRRGARRPSPWISSRAARL